MANVFLVSVWGFLAGASSSFTCPANRATGGIMNVASYGFCEPLALEIARILLN
ncbi:unnamed protein product [Acanthoscelides obtectus]|uniref:Uncharacterized protein n=1 Tax=Acanthoscelides obtectus TaxID=200917 RepID=A0A9P0KBC4_ACAOB|nr:unnamed protein product [Acanthoscelides obtectus]CAK1657680.1 hypothetical protein AOBTE_LOCUS20475 [Acanthoscelides obtectus]